MNDSAPQTPFLTPKTIELTRWVAVASLLGLILVGLLWELWLAPLREGGSWCPESTALVLAIGRFVEKSHVHLPVGQPHDLALFHRGRGTCLGRQRVVQWACTGPNHFVCHFICSLRIACALALSNGARRR